MPTIGRICLPSLLLLLRRSTHGLNRPARRQSCRSCDNHSVRNNSPTFLDCLACLLRRPAGKKSALRAKKSALNLPLIRTVDPQARGEGGAGAAAGLRGAGRGVAAGAAQGPRVPRRARPGAIYRISLRQASLSRATKQLMPTPRGRRTY